jgi:hypothetical protein
MYRISYDVPIYANNNITLVKCSHFYVTIVVISYFCLSAILYLHNIISWYVRILYEYSLK